jgi:DNA-binding MarR family transcriptional regulator
MESQGYVIRRRNADDERVVTVRLTDAGEALKERAREIPGRIAGCIELSEQEILSLYGILYKVLDQIGEEE